MKKVYGYALALVATLTFGGALATSANAADDDSATSTPAVTNSANSDKSVAATPAEWFDYFFISILGRLVKLEILRSRLRTSKCVTSVRRG